MRLPFFRILITCIGLLVTFSCKKDPIIPKDIKIPHWKPVIAVPLVTGDFTVADIMDTIPDNNSIEVNEEGLISLVYSGNLYSLKPGDILEIPDQEYEENYTIPMSEQMELLEGLSVSVSEEASFPFNIPLDDEGNEIRLDRLYFKTGTIRCFTDLSENLEGNVSLTIEELIGPGGEVFELDLQTNTGEADIEVPLSGYVLDLTDTGENEELTITAEGNLTASEEFSPGNAELSFGAEIEDLVFERLEGYFGNLTLSTDQDSIELSIFDNSSGNVHLVEPNIELKIKHSFGLSARVDFVDFESVNTESGEVYPIEGPGFPNPIIVNAANSIDEPSVDTYNINAQNSNMNELLEITPKVIYGRVEATSNPENDPSEVNFIDEDSELNIDIDVNIPMWGRSEVFFADTFDLALDEIEDVEEIDSASVRFIFDNGFPVELLAQLYTLDSLNVVTDSLFDDSNDLSGAQTNSNGIVSTATKTLFDVRVNRDRLNSLIDSESIFLRTSVNTTGVADEQNVRFYDYYRLGFNCGIKVYPTVDLNDD